MRRTRDLETGPLPRRRRVVSAGLILTGLVLAGWVLPARLPAAEKGLPSDLALVSPDEPAFLSVRVGDLVRGKAGQEFASVLRKEVGPLAGELHQALGVAPADIERLTFLPTEQVSIVRTVKPYDKEKLLEAWAPGAKEQKLHNKTVYLNEKTGNVLYPVDEHVFVASHQPVHSYGFGGPDFFERPAPKGGKGPLSDALRLAAQKNDVVVGINPAAMLRMRMEGRGGVPGLETKPPLPSAPPASTQPSAAPPKEDSRKESIHPPRKPEPPPPPPPPDRESREPDIQALLQDMPPEMLPYKPLLLAQSVVVVVNFGEETRVSARLSYSDPDQARDGETAVRSALFVARESLPRFFGEFARDPETRERLQPLMRRVATVLKEARVQTRGSVVTATGEFKVDAAALAGTLLQLRSNAERMRSSNNLKQIALAFHNVLGTYGFFPPAAIYGKDGKALLSWRVAILPFIEQDALYRQFHLDEPWDSAHNKKLLEKMPKTYAPVRGQTKEPYSTYYQVFVGPGTPFNQRADGSQPFGARGPTPAQFTDGTSNTFLIVEAGEAVPWTKPEDIPYDPKKPVPKLGGLFGYGFNAAMADGSVQFFPKDLDEQTLRNLINPADGNPVYWDKLSRDRKPFQRSGLGATPGKIEPVEIHRPRGDEKPPDKP